MHDDWKAFSSGGLLRGRDLGVSGLEVLGQSGLLMLFNVSVVSCHRRIQKLLPTGRHRIGQGVLIDTPLHWESCSARNLNGAWLAANKSWDAEFREKPTRINVMRRDSGLVMGDNPMKCFFFFSAFLIVMSQCVIW